MYSFVSNKKFKMFMNDLHNQQTFFLIIERWKQQKCNIKNCSTNQNCESFHFLSFKKIESSWKQKPTSSLQGTDVKGIHQKATSPWYIYFSKFKPCCVMSACDIFKYWIIKICIFGSTPIERRSRPIILNLL